MKTCSQCGLDKPLDSFSHRMRLLKRTGETVPRYEGACKACHVAYSAAYQRKPGVRERQQTMRANKRLAGVPLRPRGKRYCEKTPQEKAAQLESQRRWRAANKEKAKHQWRQYAAIRRSERFARDWPLVVAHYGNCCLSCGTTGGKLIPDHVIPLDWEDERYNCLSNLQPLCKACNGKKSGLALDYRKDNGWWIFNNIPLASSPFIGKRREGSLTDKSRAWGEALPHVFIPPVSPEEIQDVAAPTPMSAAEIQLLRIKLGAKPPPKEPKPKRVKKKLYGGFEKEWKRDPRAMRSPL